MEQNIEEKRESILDRIADMISRFMIVMCIMIFAVMVFSVSYGVLGRYLPFIRNPRWTQELAILCMVWLCFLGAGYAIKEGLHVRMTIIEFLVPKKAAAFLHRLAYAGKCDVDSLWNPNFAFNTKGKNVCNRMANEYDLSFCCDWRILWNSNVFISYFEGRFLGYEYDSDYSFACLLFYYDYFRLSYFLFHDGIGSLNNPLSWSVADSDH